MNLYDINKKRPAFLEDLKGVSINLQSMVISNDTSNLNLISKYDPLDVWLINLKIDKLEHVLENMQPKFLHIYGCQVDNLSILSRLAKLETCIIIWNSKLTHLWEVGRNTMLRNLHIEDVSKLSDLKELATGTQLKYLGLEGGLHKPLRLQSLSPIGSLFSLEYLNLMNFRVQNDSIKPIARLLNLKELRISNQFKTEEFAWLSTKLLDTKCSCFKAYTRFKGRNKEGSPDTMITGSRKPFLNSDIDKDKIEEFERRFDKLIEKCQKEDS